MTYHLEHPTTRRTPVIVEIPHAGTRVPADVADSLIIEDRDVLRDALPSAPQRLAYLYRLLLAREPSTAELSLLLTVVNRQTTAFRKSPESATKLLLVGEFPTDTSFDPIELAAWATVCSTVMNLDEAITRG